MGVLLVLTPSFGPSAQVLPALGLLAHVVHVRPPEAGALLDAPDADVVIVDARRDLAGARGLCRLLRTTGLSIPLMAVLTEGGLAGVSADWGVDDLLLEAAGPAEVEARLRLAVGRGRAADGGEPDGLTRAGELIIDEHTYSCPAPRAAARPDLQGVRAAEVPGPAPRPGVLPGRSCSRRCGATTTTAAPAPSTCTSAGCGRSSAPSTSS